MAAFNALVKRYFDQRGLKYRESEKGFLSVTFNADNINEVTVLLDIDDENGKAELLCFSIGQFQQDKFAQGLIACNTCNAKYRWVKFYMDDDNDVCARSDAMRMSQAIAIAMPAPKAGPLIAAITGFFTLYSRRTISAVESTS